MSTPSTKSDQERRTKSIPAPSVGEFLRPRWFFGFLRAFIGSWFLSRNYRAFFAGMPALVFAFAGGIIVWRLSQPPDETLAVKYEHAAIKAGQLESHAESDLMWERLMQLRPDDDRYRFVLAQNLAERDELAEAGRHLEVLTGERGYTPARLWLVRQARLESPKFPLSTEQQVKQLQDTIREEPQNTEAHRLLAQTYIEREDYRLAEQHLLHATESHPTLGLLLHELQTRLGRQDPEKSEEYLRNAARGFAQLAVQAPQNAEARIYWAQTLDYLGQNEAAEDVLTQAMKSIESRELQSATAAYLARRAQQLIGQSPLNAPVAADYVARAAAIEPGEAALPPLCIALAGIGTKLPDETLTPVISHLQTRIEEDPADIPHRLLLAHLMTIREDYDEATQLLEPHVDEHPSVQSLLVRVYRLAGREEDADALNRSMVTSLESTIDADSDNLEPVIQLATALITTRQFREAVTLIDNWTERNGQQLPQLPPQLKQFYIASCVAIYQELIAADPNDSNAFQMLAKAAETHQVSTQLLQLLAELAYGDSTLAEPANEMLTQILAGGRASEQIYMSLGTLALTSGDVDAAVDHLRLALAQAPHNPVIQNNLALALVRQSDDNAGPAFELCSQALETMPNQPDVLSTRAEIQIARKRWPEARLDLEAALASRPKSILVRQLLVLVYTELNETGLAAEHQKVLDRLMQEQKASAEAGS